MPQLGETVVEGTITKWLKQVGERVEADEPLVEVSTDKVDSEIPSPAAGTVTKILAQEGETVGVGTVICEIGADGEAAARVEKPVAVDATAAAAPPPFEEEAVRGKPARTGEEAPPPERARPAAAAPTPELASTEAEPRRGILSPLVRKLAAEYGVELARVRGTGTGGRITKQDVLGFVEAGGAVPGVAAGAPAAAPAPAVAARAPTPLVAARPAPAPSAATGEEVVGVSHMRKAIAEHMVTSLRETARAWNTIEVDMTAIARLRERSGPAFKEREGFSLTWTPFVCKAVTQTLLRYPQVNSTWNGDGTITRKHYVNLGIAVALEAGLIVPVIKGADGMNLVGLARAVRDLADRSRNRKLVPDDVQGGTFTITNPGPFGSILSVPIINKGQAAILAFDAVVKRPVVVTDEHGSDSIAIRHMVFLSLSWDHRIIDGAEAATFLSHLKQLLEEADFATDLSAYLPASG